MRTHKPEPWKGIVAGAAAGLAASWTMNQFQIGLSKIKERHQPPPEEESQHDQSQSEDATMKTASAISRTVFGKELTADQKKQLGPVVHYGFGALMGALYGGLSEEFSPAKSAWGTAFGSALFIGADEIAIPIFGLGSGPTKSLLSTHLYAWASHLVYGAVLESVRRPVRSSLGYDDPAYQAQELGEDGYKRVRDFAAEARKRARSKWKTGMKSGEKTFRKMRKAA